MTRDTTAIDQAIARRLGAAYIRGLRVASNMLRIEARKHHEAANEIEGEDGDEEALLHRIEGESLTALADRIDAMPDPYAAATMGESNG